MYASSRSLCTKLREKDPYNSQWQRDLAVSHDGLGDVFKEQGELQKARQEYQYSVEIRQRLALQDPHNLQWQKDLKMSLNKLDSIQKAYRSTKRKR